MLGKRYVRETRSEINKGVYSLRKKDTTNPTMFNEKDKVNFHHKDPVVMTLRVGPCNIFRILVDTRILVDLLFLSTFHVLRMHEEDITKKEMPLM